MMKISQRYVQDIEKSYSYIWDILLDFMSSIVNFGNRNIFTYTFFHFKTQTYRYNHRHLWSHITKCFLLYSTIKFSWSLLFFKSISFFFNLFSNPVGCYIGKSWKCFTCFCSLHRFLKYIIDKKKFATNHIFTIHRLCDLGQVFWDWVPLRQANISCVASCSKI